jgi:hypothetical protein
VDRRVTRAKVDRIEGGSAVLELAGREVVVPVALLPEGTREGDTLEIASMPAARDEVAARRASLSRDDPGGDVSL